MEEATSPTTKGMENVLSGGGICTTKGMEGDVHSLSSRGCRLEKKAPSPKIFYMPSENLY